MGREGPRLLAVVSGLELLCLVLGGLVASGVKAGRLGTPSCGGREVGGPCPVRQHGSRLLGDRRWVLT